VSPLIGSGVLVLPHYLTVVGLLFVVKSRFFLQAPLSCFFSQYSASQNKQLLAKSGFFEQAPLSCFYYQHLVASSFLSSG
jgi:hypothetical protein